MIHCVLAIVVCMLCDRDHSIYKQWQRPPNGLNELRFYEKIWAEELALTRAQTQTQESSGAQSGEGDERQRESVREPESASLSAALRRYRRWVPRYYGVFAISAERLAAICADSPYTSLAEPTSHKTRTRKFLDLVV